MADDGGLVGNNRIVNGRTFVEWKRDVNRRVAHRCGLTCDDLPDVDYWQLWNDATTVDDAALEVLEAADFPFDD